MWGESMDDKLLRFLEKIEFNPEFYSFFNGAKVKQVVVNNKLKKWMIYLSLEEILPINVFLELQNLRRNIKEVEKIEYFFDVKNLSMLEEYFTYFLTDLSKDIPTLNTIMDNEIKYDKDKVTVEVINKMELNKFKTVTDELEKKLQKK